MTNSSAPAKSTEGDAKTKVPPSDASAEEEDKDKEASEKKIEGPSSSEQTGLQSEAATALCTPSDAVPCAPKTAKGLNDAEVTADGSLIIKGDRTAATPEAQPEKKEGFWGGLANIASSAWNAVTETASKVWENNFGSGAEFDYKKNEKGQTEEVTVKEKDGDVITSNGEKTTIQKSDGTIVTRENRETTVSKDGISVTRDREGNETFRLADGTTGKIDSTDNLDVRLKELHDKVNDRGVTGELRDVNGKMRTYFHGGRRRLDQLTSKERNNDIVEGLDGTRMRLEANSDVYVTKDTDPTHKGGLFTKDGDTTAVKVEVVDGQNVVMMGKVDAQGKPIEGSFNRVTDKANIPDWFHDIAKRRGCNSGGMPEVLAAIGIKGDGKGDITVSSDGLNMGRKPSGELTVGVQTGPGEKDVVEFKNDGKGVQTTTDLKNNQSTVYDGTTYKQFNGDKEQLSYNAADRHLKVFDEKGNVALDSTREGTHFANGDYLGKDGSYTGGKDGQRLFSAEAATPQQVGAIATQAISTVMGPIGDVKSALAQKGAHVDVGGLASSVGSLTNALAVMYKSGHFDKMNDILSRLGECQELLGRGIAQNADNAVRHAALPEATPSQLAHRSPGPNDVVVAAVRRDLQQDGRIPA